MKAIIGVKKATETQYKSKSNINNELVLSNYKYGYIAFDLP